MATRVGPPEITIHAPIERVRISLIVQIEGEGSTLASQTDRHLVFVRQVSNPLTSLETALKPRGAPYVRAIYTLVPEAHGTHVSVSHELVGDYGTASERVAALDSPALRQEEQRGLLREQVNVERH